MRALGSEIDLLHIPVLGTFLRWRHARTAAQAPFLALAGIVLFDGFTGAKLAPRNLAGVLPWVHWLGLVVLALLVGGNLFCFGCPFMLPSRLAKRLFPARRSWPARLRNKWLAAGMWLSHYGYHLLTGGLTLVPAFQGFFASLGLPLLGQPHWLVVTIISPEWRWLTPLTLDRIAGRRHRRRRTAWREVLPWAALAMALFGAGVWRMGQPMEMRGTAFLR